MSNDENIYEEDNYKLKRRLKAYCLNNEIKLASPVRNLCSNQNEKLEKSFSFGDYGKLPTKLPLGKTSSSQNRINELFSQLLVYIDKITDKITNIVCTEEGNFISAYKQEITQIKMILEDYKKKISEYEGNSKIYNELFLKKNLRKFLSEEGRKTAELCDKLLIENKNLKYKMSLLEDDRNFILERYTALKKLTKENKIRNKYCSLFSSNEENVRNKLNENLESFRFNNINNINNVNNINNMNNINNFNNNSYPDFSDFSGNIKGKFKNIDYSIKIKSFLLLLKDIKISEKEKDDQITKYVNNIIEKNKLIYSNLQYQINMERKKIYKIQNFNNNIRTQKSELEQIFYDCVEEVKKNRSQTILHRTKSESNLKSSDKLRIMGKLISNKYMLDKIYNLIFNSKFQFFENFDKDRDSKVEIEKTGKKTQSKLGESKLIVKEKETPQKFNQNKNNRNATLNSGNTIHKSFIINKGRLLFSTNENKKLAIKGIQYPLANKEI